MWRIVKSIAGLKIRILIYCVIALILLTVHKLGYKIEWYITYIIPVVFGLVEPFINEFKHQDNSIPPSVLNKYRKVSAFFSRRSRHERDLPEENTFPLLDRPRSINFIRYFKIFISIIIVGLVLVLLYLELVFK